MKIWAWPTRRAARLRGRDWARAFVTDAAAPAPPELNVIAETLAPAWREARRARADAQAEAARLTTVLDGLDTAIVALDAAGRLQFANRAAVGLWALDAVRPGERPATLARIPELAEWVRAGIIAPKSGRLELSDGRVLQLEAAPWAGGAVLAARDVTGIARLETMRRDFIAGVSHELRTPVTSIRGYAEMLEEELTAALPAPGLWREPLTVIRQNALRLEKLAADLVTLSSMETGQYPFQFRRLNAAELLAPAAAVLRPLALERGAEITVGAAEAGWVRADAEALHRALSNLLENAIVHGAARPGEPGLRVEISGSVQDGFYRLQVRDNGAGIGSLDQPRVFERFYRADKSHARPGGSGLGLALVKHIAQEHGGAVEMASRLGAGSAFVIRLPLAAAPAAGEHPHA